MVLEAPDLKDVERWEGVWKSTNASGAPENSSLPVLGDDAADLARRERREGTATPSSRRRVDGVEDDAPSTTRRKILISTQQVGGPQRFSRPGETRRDAAGAVVDYGRRALRGPPRARRRRSADLVRAFDNAPGSLAAHYCFPMRELVAAEVVTAGTRRPSGAAAGKDPLWF